MGTFQHYLENRKSFVTRDADYDINLAADFSDDHQDASHFLLPLLKKIKAFHWWCNIIAEEMAHVWVDPSYSRNQDSEDEEVKKLARDTALRNLMGGSRLGDTDRGLRHTPWYDIYYLANNLRSIFWRLEEAVRGEGPLSTGTTETLIQNSLQLIDGLLEAQQGTPAFQDLAERAKTRLRRIKRVLEVTLPQIKRMGQIGIAKKHNPTDILGRRTKI